MTLAQRSKPFLDYLEHLAGNWPEVALEDLVEGAGGPHKVAVLGVDILKGFCDSGALASPRVRRMVPEAVRIVDKARSLGVKAMFFPCDAHPPDSPEFDAFPPHCLEGTEEAELVEELTSLPYSGEFTVLPKRSIDAFVGTDLHEMLRANSDLGTFICLGDCSDICLYQMALGVRLLANTYHYEWEVVVPAKAVETYDLPLSTAEQVGALAHDAELLHHVFLYHLQLNGVCVVSDLT